MRRVRAVAIVGRVHSHVKAIAKGVPIRISFSDNFPVTPRRVPSLAATTARPVETAPPRAGRVSPPTGLRLLDQRQQLGEVLCGDSEAGLGLRHGRLQCGS